MILSRRLHGTTKKKSTKMNTFIYHFFFFLLFIGDHCFSKDAIQVKYLVSSWLRTNLKRKLFKFWLAMIKGSLVK